MKNAEWDLVSVIAVLFIGLCSLILLIYLVKRIFQRQSRNLWGSRSRLKYDPRYVEARRKEDQLAGRRRSENIQAGYYKSGKKRKNKPLWLLDVLSKFLKGHN
jgi:hypothetical protein